MKKPSFTQSMSLLHTWGGLVLGWLLFVIFLSGSLAVFDQEIDNWMHPELPVAEVEQAHAAQVALDYLKQRHPEQTAWRISLPGERTDQLSVSVGEGRRNAEAQFLDPRSGEPLASRKSTGGYFFFSFHFLLNLPVLLGIWTTGFAAVAMLVALVSGIVIHKKIFKDFFTFRPAKGQRSWLDVHNVTGVLMLPFHLMIAYTALSIFAMIYMPAGVHSVFNGDNKAFTQQMYGGQRFGGPQVPKERGEPAPGADIAEVLVRAREVLGPVTDLSIGNPGYSTARIQARASMGNTVELTKGRTAVFDGVTGELLEPPTPTARRTLFTQRVMTGLHFAQFGGYPVRWLYFICGMASCVMIATGLVIFTLKRRRASEQTKTFAYRVYRSAEHLNVAIVAGLIVACGALLWSNHLLPAQLAERSDWEQRVFFGIWLLTLLHAFLRPWRKAWCEQLCLAAVLCLGLPLLNAFVDGQAHHPWLEGTSVGFGLILLRIARRVANPPAEVPARKRKSEATEVTP